MLPYATTLSLRVTNEVEHGRGPTLDDWEGTAPETERALGFLFMGKVQRRMFLPASNVFVVLLRRRSTYEGARAPRCGASPPSSPI